MQRSAVWTAALNEEEKHNRHKLINTGVNRPASPSYTMYASLSVNTSLTYQLTGSENQALIKNANYKYLYKGPCIMCQLTDNTALISPNAKC